MPSGADRSTGNDLDNDKAEKPEARRRSVLDTVKDNAIGTWKAITSPRRRTPAPKADPPRSLPRESWSMWDLPKASDAEIQRAARQLSGLLERHSYARGPKGKGKVSADVDDIVMSGGLRDSESLPP